MLQCKLPECACRFGRCACAGARQIIRPECIRFIQRKQLYATGTQLLIVGNDRKPEALGDKSGNCAILTCPAERPQA